MNGTDTCNLLCDSNERTCVEVFCKVEIAGDHAKAMQVLPVLVRRLQTVFQYAPSPHGLSSLQIVLCFSESRMYVLRVRLDYLGDAQKMNACMNK